MWAWESCVPETCVAWAESTVNSGSHTAAGRQGWSQRMAQGDCGDTDQSAPTAEGSGFHAGVMGLGTAANACSPTQSEVTQ